MEDWGEAHEFEASCTFYECEDWEVTGEMCWVEDCYANDQWTCQIVNTDMNFEDGYESSWCDTYAIGERNVANPEDFGLDASCSPSVNYWCQWWQWDMEFWPGSAK